MSRFETVVKIVNVVVTATLQHRLDLRAIVRALPFLQYRPEQFPGAIFRLKKPRTTTLLFSTGKMVSVGAKSEKEAAKGVRTVIKNLKKSGVLIMGTPEIVVQNIVANADLGGAVDLVGFCESGRHGGNVLYEPEQFPAVIYRMKEPRAVMLIFASGKVICTGVKKEKDVCIAVNELLGKLEDQKVIHKR